MNRGSSLCASELKAKSIVKRTTSRFIGISHPPRSSLIIPDQLNHWGGSLPEGAADPDPTIGGSGSIRGAIDEEIAIMLVDFVSRKR